MPAQSPTLSPTLSNHRGIAGIVFRDTGFDLANHVSTDVGALGEDTAAETREDRNQRRAEAEGDKSFENVPQARRIVGIVNASQNHVITGDAQQTEPDDQHAGDGARLERNGQGRLQSAGAGSIRRPHVGADRNMHADITGRARQNRAEKEPDRRINTEQNAKQNAYNDADHADRHVLAIQISLRAFLDGAGDFLHFFIAAG